MAMRKFVRRFSSSSLEIPPSERSSDGESRERSISELYTSDLGVPPLTGSGGKSGPRANVEYLGYTYVNDPKSAGEIQTAIRTVKQTSCTRDHWVHLSVKSGAITVHESTGELVLMSSVGCVSQVSCELSRGPNDCLAVTFSSGHNSKQCHVFRTRAAREVS